MATSRDSPAAEEDLELIRKRRLNSRSDDEIEENIDARLSFRKGWPVLAPLPLKSYQGDATTYFPNYEEHITKIELLLQIQRVLPRNINVVHRLSLASGRTDASTATLFIIAEPNTGNMYMAVRDIRKYLAAHDIHVAIEIIDERALWIKTYPILPSETVAVQRWSLLWDPLTRYLDKVKVEWVSVTVLHRGLDLSRDSCPPTVVISARDAANDKWWNEVLPEIRNHCRSHFEVELLHEDTSPTALDPQEDARMAGSLLSISDFSSRIPMGGSCGPDSPKGSGTMGGRLRLRRNGQELGVFGLSNHHVVKSDLLEQVVDKNTALSPVHSLVVSKSLIIKAPSNRDADLRLDNVNDAIEALRKRVDGTSTTLGLQAKVDMGDQSKQGSLTNTLQAIKTNENDRKIIQDLNRTAGFVYATSGYRSVPESQGRDWALDWSLTKVETPRIMENTVDGDTATRYVRGKVQLELWQKTSSLGRQVVKLGRSTGWTEGVVNAVEAVFSSQDATYGKKVFAWPVVPPHGFPFAIPEDSGSVVFDAESTLTTGNWVGLLFAANIVSGIGYFTPMQLVLEDISTVTGCEILEPTLETPLVI